MSRKAAFLTALTETWASTEDLKKDKLGDIRIEGNKKYKCVQYNDGSGPVALAVGDVVFYSDYENNIVTPDLTDVVGCAAGVSMAALSTVTNDGDRFWIQISGVATLAVDVAAGAVGNALTHVGAADKTLDVSALVTDPVVAYLIDDTASAQKIICNFPE